MHYEQVVVPKGYDGLRTTQGSHSTISSKESKYTGNTRTEVVILTYPQRGSYLFLFDVSELDHEYDFDI